VIGSLVTASDATGCHLSDDQIIDNLMLVLFAGYDTSSTTLTRMLSLLQQHPAALQQLRQEQQQLVAAHGEELSHGVLRRMVYAEAVIRWGACACARLREGMSTSCVCGGGGPVAVSSGMHRGAGWEHITARRKSGVSTSCCQRRSQPPCRIVLFLRPKPVADVVAVSCCCCCCCCCCLLALGRRCGCTPWCLLCSGRPRATWSCKVGLEIEDSGLRAPRFHDKAYILVPWGCRKCHQRAMLRDCAASAILLLLCGCPCPTAACDICTKSHPLYLSILVVSCCLPGVGWSCWMAMVTHPTGYRIPDATPINLGLHTAAQQDPRWAGAEGDLAPHVFNPGRMLTPEGQKQGWLMPFGAGPRFCLGGCSRAAGRQGGGRSLV
jgi:hypothetical protein